MHPTYVPLSLPTFSIPLMMKMFGGNICHFKNWGRMHKKSPQADPNPNHVLIFPTLLLQNEHCLNYNYAYNDEESQMESDSSIEQHLCG